MSAVEPYSGDGRRQITALLIPGDICDLRALLLRKMDHGVAALTSCQNRGHSSSETVCLYIARQNCQS
jgi:hypothetical protein